jgi:hypothetical protein
MSKKEKRLLRLFRKPVPTDFTWDELLSVMDAANFKTIVMAVHITLLNMKADIGLPFQKLTLLAF